MRFILYILAILLLLPLILRKAAGPAELAKMSWMFAHHIDWDTRIEAGVR